MATKMYLPPKGEHRRGFLKNGLLGGAVLALGGGGALFFRPGRDVSPPPGGLKALNGKEFAVLSALCARMIPAREGFKTVEELSTAANADQVLTLVDPTALAEVRQLLNLFENALPNFLFGGRITPFTQMAAAEQDLVISEWKNSAISVRRTGYFALHNLIIAAYFGDSRTWASTGYHGPPEGFHVADAAVWKGEGPREGNGVFTEPNP